MRDIEETLRKLRRRTKPAAYSRTMRWANNAALHRETEAGWAGWVVIYARDHAGHLPGRCV
jgi:hypothetical protein